MKFTHYIDSLPYALETTSRVISEAIRLDFKESDIGISHEEFVILDTIYCHQGILQIDLAKKVLKSRAHTGKFLNTLEQKGLIKRVKAIKGSRQTILLNFLTDEGIEIYKKAINIIKKHIKETLTLNIEEEDIKKLIQFLNSLKNDIAAAKKIKFD